MCKGKTENRVTLRVLSEITGKSKELLTPFWSMRMFMGVTVY